MKYPSEVDLIVAIPVIGSIIAMFFPAPALMTNPTTGEILIFLFICLFSALLIWMVFGTYYRITKDFIHYSTGPVKGRIRIGNIHTIIVGKNLWVGFRPATALGGLIIKYGKYDEIYFSPKDKNAFIEELLKIKPTIKIEDRRKKNSVDGETS